MGEAVRRRHGPRQGQHYSWEQAFEKIDELSTPPCFAGFCDWRLPNSFELYSLLDLGNVSPAVSAPFNTGCVTDCTVLTCSCTASMGYWSATTYPSTPQTAWLVNFGSGSVLAGGKNPGNRVRAVRGGREGGPGAEELTFVVARRGE